MTTSPTPATRGDKFSERGIDFVLAQMDDLPKIWDFMVEEFLPEEPMSRALVGPPGSTSFKFAGYMVREQLTKGIKAGTGLLALNKDKEVMGRQNLPLTAIFFVYLWISFVSGIKIGYPAKMSDSREPNLSCCCVPLFLCIWPKAMVQTYSAMELIVNDLRYDPHKAMEDLGAESVFVGDILGVSKKARGLGLGAELINR